MRFFHVYTPTIYRSGRLPCRREPGYTATK
jgi:hypothetical protein